MENKKLYKIEFIYETSVHSGEKEINIVATTVKNAITACEEQFKEIYKSTKFIDIIKIERILDDVLVDHLCY